MAERFPVIEAGLDPVEAVGRARVMFRAGGTTDWFFVEMKQEQGRFRGVLPKPLAATKQIEYYVEVLDRSLAPARTADHRATVAAAGGCAPGVLAAPALSSAEVALGPLAPGGPALPPGFSPASVAGATVGTTGAVAGAAAGATAVAGAAAAGAGAASAGGLSTAAVLGIVGGAVAAGGVAVAVASGGSEDSAAPPAGLNVAGRWVGSMRVDPGGCTIDANLTLDLTQSGSSLSGTATIHELAHLDRADCNAQAGQTLVTPCTGSVAGSAVTLTLAGPHNSATPFTGTVTGNTMSGTFAATGPSDPGGTWRVTRQ